MTKKLRIETETCVRNTWTWEEFTETVAATFGPQFAPYCRASDANLTSRASADEFVTEEGDEPLTDDYLLLWLDDTSGSEYKNVLLYALAERGVIPNGEYKFSDL